MLLLDMVNGKTNKVRKARVQPIRAFVRQARWLLWRSLSGERCCFCGEVLIHEADLKTLNNITIHHIKGDKHKDNFSKVAPVQHMLFAHSFCHKSFHLTERMFKQGKKVDVKKLRSMERNVAKAIKKNGRM